LWELLEQDVSQPNVSPVNSITDQQRHGNNGKITLLTHQ